MFLWNVSSALGILIVATGKHGQFVELAFDTDQIFLILKSIFSLNLCEILHGCLLFLGLDMFFMVTRV